MSSIDGSSTPSRRQTLKSGQIIQSHAKANVSKEPEPNKPVFHVGEEVVGGFSAGVIGTLLGYPLDLAKTRMQTQLTSGDKTRSTISLLSHILRTEGIKSMYKGIAPPLVSLSIVNTLSFTSYSYFRQNHFHGQAGWDYNNALSGMMGAPIFGLVTTPENFLKTQMQLDNVHSEREKVKKNHLNQSQLPDVNKNLTQEQPKPRGKFTSSFHCAKTLVSSNGLSVLYTGHLINTIREAAFVGMYFFCYEGYKFEFQKLLSGLEHLIRADTAESANNNDTSSWSTSFAIPIAGGCAGATSWFLTFPLDCVRAGVQGQQISPTTHLNKQGALQILKQLLQTKGIMGFYAGVAPSIARAFLVSGSRFSAYEGALWLCRRSGLTGSDGNNK